MWNIIFVVSAKHERFQRRVRYFTFLREFFRLWRIERSGGMNFLVVCPWCARDIPIGCALIANPIRVVWTETRWQIDSSSVERLAEMQLKGYRLSRNKRDTNRIEAVIDRSSNSHDFETRRSKWNSFMKHIFLGGGKKYQYSSILSNSEES